MKHIISIFLSSIFIVLLFSQCASVKVQNLAQKNQETLEIWFEQCWNKGNCEENIERCFDPKWRDGNPLLGDQTAGYKGVRKMVEAYNSGCKINHMNVTHILATDTQVAVRFEIDAVHTGNLFGIPPSGKAFHSTGNGVYEMRDGRIHVSWLEMDLTGLFNQINETTLTGQ